MAAELRKMISSEVYKAARRRSTLAVPVIVILATVLVFVAVDLAAQRHWAGIPSGFYLLARVIEQMQYVIALLAVIMTCFHVSGEFSQGTVKAVWVRPVGRRGWYAGKLLCAAGAVVGLLLLAVLTGVVLAWAKYGFAGLMEKDYMVHSAGSLAGRFALSILLTTWAYLGLVAATAAVAAFINRAGAAIAVVAVIAFLMMVLSMFPAFEPFLLSTCLGQPLEQMTFMSKGLPLPLEWDTLIWRELVCTGAWMAAALAAGLLFIGKKEITF